MFCANCGTPASDDAPFCWQCGHRIAVQSKRLIQILSQKIRTQAVLLTITACVQSLLALFLFCLALFFAGSAKLNIAASYFCIVVLLAVGAFANFAYASHLFMRSGQILLRPIGIISEYQPTGTLINLLAFNLLLGCLLGPIGMIYGFGVRRYVIAHIHEFDALERQSPPTS